MPGMWGRMAESESPTSRLEQAADAVLAASIFHFGEYSIMEAKRHMADAGVAVRLDGAGADGPQ